MKIVQLYMSNKIQDSYVSFVQVTLLHVSLEQERSKVKGLQSEQPKHQVSTNLKPDGYTTAEVQCAVFCLNYDVEGS